MECVVIAGVVFQHESIEPLIRELSGIPALLEACGFDVLPRYNKPVARLKLNEETGQMEIVHSEVQDVYCYSPNSWNFSRFLRNVIGLEEGQGMVTDMIRQLRKALMKALTDFGRHLGYDGKSIKSHSTGHGNRGTGKTSDTYTDWAKHETKGIQRKSLLLDI